MNHPTRQNRPWQEWELYRAITPRNLAVILVICLLLALSARNTEIDQAFTKTARAVVSVFGLTDSQVLDGAIRFGAKAFPLQISQRTDVSRLEQFDPEKLPWLARVEQTEIRSYDPLNATWHTEEVQILIEPIGYLLKVLKKMWETIEMGFWGTLLSFLISLPLGILASRNYAPHPIFYALSRGLLSYHRAMPELILALFLVLIYGFGPIAGVLALAIHTSGVLGKFFADEIENAPPGPQLALGSSGAGRLKVLYYSVIPHVFPAWIAYLQYIFERNIRTATVLGIVGAGGIGMELKGRWDLFDYGHVSTILLVIFLTVIFLETVSQRIRRHVM